MKGIKKQVKNKKVFKAGAGKQAKRASLHSGNHQWNAWHKAHHLQTEPDGYPQGKHDVKNKETCRCGGCSNKNNVDYERVIISRELRPT